MIIKKYFIHTLLIIVILNLFLSCLTLRESKQIKEPEPIILSTLWEAWDEIRLNYLEFSNVNIDEVNNDMIMALSDVSEISPYALLTKLANSKVKVPEYVPQELADVWKTYLIVENQSENFDEKLTTQVLIYALIKSFKNPELQYLTSDEYKALNESIKGYYEGIGIYVREFNGRPVIVALEDSGPAEKAGIMVGDIILAVDGTNIENRSFIDSVKLVRGTVGSLVSLTISRQGTIQETSIERQKIFSNTVGAQLFSGSIGYIYIPWITDETGNQFSEVLLQIRDYDPLALIIDLRNSSGYSLVATESILFELLQKDLYMYKQNLDSIKTPVKFDKNSEKILSSPVPIVILTNQQTSGVSELVSAVLQDSSESVVIGESTAKYGIDKKIVFLNNGQILTIPNTLWITSNGNIIKNIGVVPTIKVSQSIITENPNSEVDLVLERALNYLNEILPYFR